MRLLADTRPLRTNPVFRRLWVGTSLSTLGGQFASFAVIYHVWETTGSPAAVGAVSLTIALPLVIFALVGGSLADTVDRRRLALIATSGQIAVSLTIVLLLLVDAMPLGVLFVLVAAASACSAAGAPVRKAFVPRLLPDDQVAAGLALTHLSFQLALLAGPALAGVITASWGVVACFALDTATFVAALYGIVGLPAMRPDGPAPTPGVRGVWQAARFVSRTPTVGGAFLCDLLATTLSMPVALFPVINDERFGGAPQTLGLLMTAIGAGGLVASVASGAVTRSARPGRVLLAAGMVWGAALGGIGLTHSLAVALALVATAGAADTVSVVARGTIVQLGTPDAYRGRVSAMDYVIGAAGPQVGNLRAGLVASVSSGGVAFLAGGALCVATLGLVAMLVPPLRRFDLTARAAPAPATSAVG